VRGKELDARTDLFSFGAVLYGMATGQLPSELTHPERFSIRFWVDRHPRQSDWIPTCPPSGKKIINKALDGKSTPPYDGLSQQREVISGHPKSCWAIAE
jgi:eukaryotic-like serine/threonine-protein kinase